MPAEVVTAQQIDDALVTICIPSSIQHAETWLYRAVVSAYAQTIPSTVKYMIDTDKRRAAWVRNRIVETVDTPYIVFLDADDWLHQTFVEKTLEVWKPGTYVYTDMIMDVNGRPTHVPAISCYGYEPKPGEARFHHPTVLMPTEIYRRLGGMDETLYGGEDTDFFLKANSRLVHSIVLRRPLMGYTSNGHYSREAQSRANWGETLKGIYKRYEGMLTMACCGDIGEPLKVAGVQLEGDIQARPRWHAVQRTHGRVTQRYYGRINNKYSVWIDPRDFNESEWARVEEWAEAAGTPTPADVKKVLDNSGPVDREKAMLAAIAKAGVRVWSDPPQKVGYDMQQAPTELARFIVAMQDADVKNVLEIGTGESGGLARFMVEILGWNVVSIDLNEPNVPDSFKTDNRWTFLKGDTRKIKLDRIPVPEGGQFDLVFIDGDHSYDGVKSDYERFGDLGRIVAFHDIAPDTWFQDGLAYYRELAYTTKGNLRKHWFESVAKQSKAGIGWYVKPQSGAAADE